MCIIIAKESGKKIPEKNLLKRCWIKNPDGGGLMFNDQNKVIIVKGFMNFDSFYDKLTELNQEYNFEKKGLIIHFRISTSGVVDNGNCHPYPITDNVKYLRATHVKCNFGVAHNGVIRDYNRKDQLLNDTQLFIKNIVYNLFINMKHDYY